MSIKVYNTKGILIDINSYNAIQRFVNNKQAKWISYNEIQLLVSEDELIKRKLIPKILKKRIIEEEKRICYICGKKIPKHETPTIDHLISVSNGGNNDRNNLRCCCYDCNKDKGYMDIEEYYKHILQNINDYSHLALYQLKSLEKTVNKVKKNYPIITSSLDENNFSIHINNKESFNINKNNNLKEISEEILKLIKDINSNYIVKIERSEKYEPRLGKM